jgi:hypothetical protein
MIEAAVDAKLIALQDYDDCKQANSNEPILRIATSVLETEVSLRCGDAGTSKSSGQINYCQQKNYLSHNF